MKPLKISAALFALAAVALAKDVAPSPTPDNEPKELLKEANQKLRAEQQDISAVLSFYQQLRNLRLSGMIKVYDEKPGSAVTVSKYPYALRRAVRAGDQVMGFMLELRDGKGTITYRDGTGKVISERSASVFVSNDFKPICHDDTVPEGIAVRATLGCPHGGEEGIYAKDLFGKDLGIADHLPDPSKFKPPTGPPLVEDSKPPGVSNGSETSAKENGE